VKNQKVGKPVNKADRLEAIEIADERTERTQSDLDRNIGSETDGDAGSAGSPQGDGNSLRRGDIDVPLNVDTGGDK